MGSVVNSVAYKDGRRVGEVTIEDISEVLKEPGTFVWLGLHEPSESLLKQIQEEFGLHELAVEDAHRAHQRPKLEEYGESLFIVLQTAQLWNNDIHLGETHIFFGARHLVTVRHGPSLPYSQVRQRCEGNPQRLAKGPAYPLYAVMDFVVDNYSPIVDALDERLESLESEIFRGRFDTHTVERIYELKREILQLRNAAAPLKDVCAQLMRFYPELVPKEMRAYFRDIFDHVTRVTEAADRMHEMLTSALQVNLALVTVRQNEVVKRLAGWGAILAIPTMVFSMYGMNFRHMPELDLPFGYPLALLATAAGCAWLYRRLKETGWL